MEDFYTELIMEHSMSSPNKRELNNPTFSCLGHNPNCGDEITLQAVVENGILTDLAFMGHGCAISQSSTSIMIDVLKGKTVDQARSIIQIFIKMIKREELTTEEKDRLKDAIAFENVSNMPARAKCATLSWHTLDDLLNQLK